METKLFEVLDRSTQYVVAAQRTKAADPRAQALLNRSGFDEFTVLLTVLDADLQIQHDPYAWRNRTLKQAHIYISENFDSLLSGAVVDVEIILGEKLPAQELRLAA